MKIDVEDLKKFMANLNKKFDLFLLKLPQAVVVYSESCSDVATNQPPHNLQTPSKPPDPTPTQEKKFN